MRPHRSSEVSLPSLLLAFLLTSTACRDPVAPSQYAEYQCPAPIGVIVRDDCSHATLKFDGVVANGGVSAGPVGVHASYRDTVLREADTVVTVLKDQRESLCNNYNTCKLTRDDYLREQRRIDTAFTALLGIKAGVVNMDAASAALVMQQIRDIRSGKADQDAASVAPTPPGATSHGAEAPSAPAAGHDDAPQEEWGPGKYMMQAVAGVADMAAKVAKDSAWGYDPDASAIMGAYLAKGAHISMTRPFEAAKEYALIGHGSEGTTDLDLAVRASDGSVVASDTADDANPAVSFRVPRDGSYEIVVQLTSANSSGEFVAVSTMQKGGYDVPSANIIASLSRAVTMSRLAHRKRGPLGFHESGNWSLFSTILKQNEGSNFGGLLLERDSTIFLATADDNATDIDISVKDTTTNQTYADTERDATPVVVVPSNHAAHRHAVTLKNAASRGPSFVTMVVLDGRG